MMNKENFCIRLSYDIEFLFPNVKLCKKRFVKDNCLNWFMNDFVIPKTSIENNIPFVEPFYYKGYLIFVKVSNIMYNKYLLDIMLLDET